MRAAGERLDVQRLRVLPVDPVANAAQPREVAQVLRRGGSAGHLRDGATSRPSPTILAALDAPATIQRTGRVLHEVGGSADVKYAEAEAPAVTIPGITGLVDEEATVSDTEADEMEEHLRGLGYLE